MMQRLQQALAPRNIFLLALPASRAVFSHSSSASSSGNTSFFIAFVFISSFCNSFYSNQAYAQNMPNQAELEQIESTISQVQARIQQTTSERSSVQRELADNEKQAAQLNQDLTDINRQIEGELKQLDNMRLRSAELQASKTQQQALIAQYMRSAYQSGQEEYLKLLLNQQSIGQSARALRYYQYFNKARAEKIITFNNTIVELAALEQEIQLSSTRLAQNRDQLSQQQIALQASNNQRLALLDELDVILSQSGTELANLEQERLEMTLLIEELSRAIVNLSLGAEGQNFSELKGQLPWPVTGRLLNSYGESYQLGDLDWEGVTIAGNAGEAVQAIHHGRVIFSDWFANSGLLLIIDHGDGYMSLYAHNQLLYKAVGDWVNSGETIATIGNTGGHRENGVYFEIRHNGDSVDPVTWCIARN